MEGIETKKPRRETGFYRQKEMVFFRERDRRDSNPRPPA